MKNKGYISTAILFFGSLFFMNMVLIFSGAKAHAAKGTPEFWAAVQEFKSRPYVLMAGDTYVKDSKWVYDNVWGPGAHRIITNITYPPENHSGCAFIFIKSVLIDKTWYYLYRAYLFNITGHDIDINFGTDPDDCWKQQLVGNPINVLNGNKVQEEVDLNFNSPFDAGLKLKRHYNSQSFIDSPIGFGWTHNYNIVLTKDYQNETGMIHIADGTGRGHYFKDPDGDGCYNDNHGGKDILSTDAAGNYIWTQTNGGQYAFNPATGKLLTIIDKNGNEQSLTYDPDGRLSTITDEATGKCLTLNYNAENKISHIEGPVTPAVPDGIWVSYNYDDIGNLTGVTYADDGNGSSASGFDYQYENVNDLHNLTGKKDKKGRLLSSWTYDVNDRAVSNTNNQGTGATIDYTDPLAVKITDDYGISQIYTIEEIKGRKEITQKSESQTCGSCSEGIFKTEFDPNTGLPSRREYFNGRIDLYQSYDTNNNPITRVVAQGTPEEKTITTTWHPVLSTPLTRTQKSLLADEAGPDRKRVTIWDYDDPTTPGDTEVPNENPANRIRRMILRGYTREITGGIIPFEQITAYTYNDKGQVTSVNGPLAGDQDVVTFSYDASTGDLLTVTRPLAGTISFTHDPAGNIIGLTDENQVQKAFAYDGCNRRVSETFGGVSFSVTYDAAGSPASITDRAGLTHTMTYNTKGLLQRLTDPSGNYRLHTYDENGNPVETSIFTAAGVQTLFSGLDYGDPSANPGLAPGRPAKALARNQDNTATLETLFAYEHGNLVRVIDPMSTVKTFAYDSLNRLILVQEQQSDTITAETGYAYDSNDNLIRVTDPEGLVTAYTYDDGNRLVKEVSPDTGTTVFAYDTAGNLVSRETDDGTTVQYTYDVLGRRTAIIYPETNLDIVHWYDQGLNGKGRLSGISNDGDTYEFAYDAQGNITTVLRTTPLAAFTTAYTYDPDGRLTSMACPDGRTITYERDANGNIARVTAAKDGTTQILADSISRRPFGPLASMTLGTGQQVSRGFDLNYRPLTLDAANVLDYALDYDPAGRITAVTDNLDPGRTRGFGYDRAGRLTSASGPFGSLGFTYDKTGNRLTRTRDGETQSYAYASGTNRLSRITDNNGTKEITHDTAGRILTKGDLTFEYTDAGRMLKVLDQGGVIQEAVYNSLGQRARKTAGGETTLYHYDLFGNLIGESDPGGTFNAAYVYLDDTRLAGYEGSSLHFYLNDHLGSPAKVLNSSGQVVWDGDYAPFGQVDVTVDSRQNKFRFPGQYADGETGLHYNWHRYYDPTTGRYLTPDPIGLAGGINPFIYSLNNPIRYIDIYGLKNSDCFAEYQQCEKDAENWLNSMEKNRRDEIENQRSLSSQSYEQMLKGCKRHKNLAVREACRSIAYATYQMAENFITTLDHSWFIKNKIGFITALGFCYNKLNKCLKENGSNQCADQ